MDNQSEKIAYQDALDGLTALDYEYDNSVASFINKNNELFVSHEGGVYADRECSYRLCYFIDRLGSGNFQMADGKIIIKGLYKQSVL